MRDSRHRLAIHRVRLGVVAAALCSLGACASVGTGGGTTAGSPSTAGTANVATDATWPVSTREHVDLWLHGYALLTTDTARVPFFRRGYRQRMRELKNQGNVYSQLDANFDRLSSRFVTNPSLVNGQFLPFYFSSFQQMQQVTDQFFQTGGDPRSVSDPTMQQLFAILGGAFPAPADRDWLRLFVQSLADENTRFYHGYWSAQQQQRDATRLAVDSVWQRATRPRLQRFLNNTQQDNGELILSLPLDGEGRTVTYSRQQNSVAVEFPDAPASAAEAVYVFAHEVVNAITTTAINDNVTPAEQRSGSAGRFAANATVRGGAILLQRATPELADGYMRFYLRSAGVAVSSADVAALFASTFPIPDAIRDAITRQIDVVLGGI